MIPSSIHEVILTGFVPGMDLSMMDKMVQEVNRTQVAPEERLSDHIYIYDGEAGKLLLPEEFYSAA